jgi:hypothetical protein
VLKKPALVDEGGVNKYIKAKLERLKCKN